MAKVGGRREGSGRKPGSLNKRTQEALLEQATLKHEALKSGRKLAKNILDDFMHLCAGMAAHYQPAPPEAAQNANANEAKFWQAVEMTRDFAVALAKYQSPTFKSIAVYSPPEQAPKQIDLKANPNVVQLDDPAALARVYKLRIAGVR